MLAVECYYIYELCILAQEFGYLLVLCLELLREQGDGIVGGLCWCGWECGLVIGIIVALLYVEWCVNIYIIVIEGALGIGDKFIG